MSIDESHSEETVKQLLDGSISDDSTTQDSRVVHCVSGIIWSISLLFDDNTRFALEGKALES